jgi:hypothetical protein
MLASFTLSISLLGAWPSLPPADQARSPWPSLPAVSASPWPSLPGPLAPRADPPPAAECDGPTCKPCQQQAAPQSQWAPAWQTQPRRPGRGG